ncbi:MAG: DinB family protein [Leptospiraceae bacterium]|nr:DinB family protein [Leptospiraceae bacterium]
MKSLPIINDSFTKQELFNQIDRYVDEIAAFYESLPLEIFRSKNTEKGWSIEKNLKHITSSTKAFAFLLKFPKFLLKLLGKPRNPSLSVKNFDPPTDRPDAVLGKYVGKHGITEEERIKLIDNWKKVNIKFKAIIDKYSEEELDSINTPVSGYSLRQFVLFTLIHNVHHSNVVRKRLEDTIIS